MFTSTEEEDFSSGKNKEDINWPITTDVRRVQVLYPKHDIKPNFLATAWLTISSLGIIYGDIGTSPLYVVQSMFTSPPSKEDVYGGISLVIWALTLVATIKYISIILNFNNHGEGGIFALMAMLPFSKMNRIPRALFVTLAIFGSALLIGDGVITPAISVLSAVQGLELGIHGIGRYAKWIAAFILLILFMSQRYGTAKLSTIFGPVMLLWFISIGVFGLLKIIDDPNILKAFSPVYGARFIGRHGSHGFIFLGVVVLSVTGVEALYADLGHFGARPIRFSWFIIVYPSLLLNYIGQGALLIKGPNRYDNPFYHLVPHMFFWPIIILATIATIIASQSIITGSFSLVAQAISFGYFPRLKIQHTNKKVFGQIYIAELNFLLMVLTIVITIAFGSSAKLTAAYGLAVSGVMFLTSVIFTAVLRYKYKANWLLVILYAAVFYTVDLAFLGANSSKVPNGGWLPLAIGSVLALLMIIWKTGKEKVEDVLKETHIPLENVIKLARTNLLDRVPMVGVYMNSHFDLTPLSLSLLLPRTRTLASPAIFLTVKYLPVPFISDNDRILFHSLDENENPSLGSEQTEDLQSNEETTTNFELKSERTDEEKPDASSKTGSPSVTEDDYLKEEEELSGFVEFKPQDSINIYRVIAFYGYSEVVDLKQVLSRVIDEHPLRKPPPPPTNSSDEHALMITPELTFYLNRERIKADHKKFFLHRWWVYFYSILLRNARGVVDLFHLPYDSIVQVSAPVLL